MHRNVELFTATLVRMATEEDAGCQQTILDSLHILGRHHPALVLMTCHDYLSHDTILTTPQGAGILGSMTLIIKDTLDQISQGLAQKMIILAALWMTKSTGAQADAQEAVAQEAVSDLLLAISFRFTHQVVQLAMENFKHGHLPHVYMVKTLIKMSTENLYVMVPLLKSIIGTMIPVIFGVKQDELKAVFTTAMGCFSKSILIYLANVEKASDSTVTKESFSTEIHTVYTLLFKVRLDKEPSKLNIPTVEALGYVSSLLPTDILEKELPKLIPGILSLYKKHPGHSSITECLCQVLDIAVEIGYLGPKTHIDNLFKHLHQQICLSAGTNNQLAVKNHTEILRCFTVLAPAYADALVDCLLLKLENTDQQTRVGTLSVLRHLISSVSSYLEGKEAQIVAAMKPALLDKSSNQEKKLVAQVICAMAQQGYLEPEGATAMVEFLIRQCAASVDSGTLVPPNHRPDQVTGEELITVCETVMFMITNTVQMEDVLWPFLLQCVTMTQYTKALTTICNCLAHLGKKKSQASSESLSVTYNEDANLPKAQALLARLLLVSYCPYQGGSRGAAALRLMQVLSCYIHPATARWWEEELPALVDQLLANSEESLPEREWEEKLLLLLSKTLNTIDNEEWAGQLSDEMCKQINADHRSAQEKGFLYKALGIVLSQVRSKNIKEQIHQMLQSVQHSASMEREGAAVAIGFCAMTHFDDALSSLEEFANSNRIQDTKSVFNIHRDKPDVDLDKIKSTLVLCYGNMALYAPEELVLSRIETHILPVVSQFITSGQGINAESRDLTLTLSLIKAVTLIARSLHSNRQKVSFNFIRKRELLMYMQDLIEAESPELLQSPVRQLAMSACLHLIQLHTESNQADISLLIQSCLTHTFSLVPPELDKDKDTDSNTREIATLYTQTMTALQELLKQILLQQLSPEGLQTIFKQVEDWIISTKEYERERAMDMILVLLKYYWEKLNVSNVVPLINTGTLIGRIMPRCADPSLPIRQMAVDSLYIILSIQLSYEGTNLDQQREQLEILKAVKEHLVKPDSSILLQTCYQIAGVISKCLPHDQLGNLLFMVFRGLVDQHPSCSSAAAVLTRTIIKTHGTELRDEVLEILEILRGQLQSVAYQEVKLSVLRSIGILASQNTTAVVSCLLTYPVPLDKYASDMWRSLAEDTECAPGTMMELLDTLNKQLLSREKRTYPLSENVTLYPTLESLAAICALYEMINAPESEQAVTTLFPQLFSTLLVHLSSSVNVHLPKIFVPDCEVKQRGFSAEPQTPRSGDMCVSCVETLMSLLCRVKNQQVVNCMMESGGWDQMMDIRKSHTGVVLLAGAMGKYAGPSLTGIVDELTALIPTIQECQKITVAAFFGELLKCPVVSQMQLTNALVNSLLQCLLNSSSVLQFVCIRGLGNITACTPHSTEKYSRQVLCGMICLMGSQKHDNEVLMFEVLSCLRKHLNLLKANTIKPFIIKTFTEIQPFFEVMCDKVRAEAFNVMGNLAKCGTRDPKSYLCRQIHLNLVRLLLQLDGHSEVSRSCNSTLHLVVPLIASAKAQATIEGYLREPTLNYMEFLRAISQQFIKDFPDRIHSYVMDCVSFFNNPEEHIRANAVTLSGLFLQRPEKHFQSAQRFT